VTCEGYGSAVAWSAMELLDVTLTDLQRRNRAAFVAASDLPGRPLEPGEKVVLRDQEGEFFAGSVVDLLGGRYLVHVGVRLPEEYAWLRLGGRVPQPRVAPDDVAGVQALLDLLGDARDACDGRLPSQRL
jgi:hypothetical protein